VYARPACSDAAVAPGTRIAKPDMTIGCPADRRATAGAALTGRAGNSDALYKIALLGS
jgi:hypothetical protein